MLRCDALVVLVVGGECSLREPKRLLRGNPIVLVDIGPGAVESLRPKATEQTGIALATMAGGRDDGATFEGQYFLGGAARAGGENGELSRGVHGLQPSGKILGRGIRSGNVESVLFAVECAVADQLHDDPVGLVRFPDD